MHIMGDDNSRNHIDDIVRAYRGHHEPLIAHNKEHEVVHFEPFAGTVFQGYNKTSADMSGIKKVI